MSLTYRYAPEHVFPAAIDDVDAAVRFIQDNAALRWGADPTLMTVGGSSAGGGLALASGLKPRCHGSSPFAYKAAVLLCPVL
ncbi:alpha/beta hydrolase fold domain-containing protein, partial [Staphylococcus aureus]|nr:alpha/beta hydrolase fold domain-containing protein [Staphylococcus aureus]